MILDVLYGFRKFVFSRVIFLLFVRFVLMVGLFLGWG